MKANVKNKEEGFFRIVVRPKNDFITFRMDDVGEKGHIERLAGKRDSGSWDTHAWLINKNDAHVKDHTLVPDTEHARHILKNLGSRPQWIKEDIFKARPEKHP